jgi:hypothetical protein
MGRNDSENGPVRSMLTSTGNNRNAGNNSNTPRDVKKD